MGSDVELLVRVARMYYLEQLNQEAIAGRVGISRQSVSRMLKKALDTGIVHIEVRAPQDSLDELEEHVRTRFGLDEVMVVNTAGVAGDAQSMRAVARATARLVSSRLEGTETLAVAWGRTLLEFSYGLPRTSMPGVSVVPLNGSVSSRSSDAGPEAVVNIIADSLGAQSLPLIAPLYVDNVAIQKSLSSDSRVNQAFTRARAAEIAVFSLDAASEQSGLYKAGQFSDEDLRRLRDENAVGEICGQFYDIQGVPTGKFLAARSISVALDDLKAIPRRVLIAVGESKVTATLGALNGRYATTFATDEKTAHSLLELAG